MSNNIDKTLLEVRKAYRLIYDFQSKILDLISFIGGSYKQNYEGGWCKFSNPSPKDGKGDLNNWAWDWLNMYYYEFHFKRTVLDKLEIEADNHAKGYLHFSVFLVADTGYFEEKQNNTQLNENDIYNFKNVESSKTKLIFVVGKNKWEAEGLFKYNWHNLEFVLGEEDKEGEGNEIMIFKSYDLSLFENQESAIEQLKDFEHFCNSNNIELKYQDQI